MNAIDNRSGFVTALAWVFIVLSGFSTMISVLQNAMVWTMFHPPQMAQAMAEQPRGMPPYAAFLMGHFQWFFLAFLLVSATTLASSIGLLKRMEWARVVFIALMFLGIAWNLFGLVGQFVMMAFMNDQFAAMPKSANEPDMQPFFVAIMAVSAIFAIGFSVLFGWIAKRLLSREIKAEFGASS
jgi:hypothetical protein